MPFANNTFVLAMKNSSHVQFYTATILNWNKLLLENKYKEIILNSLSFLIKNGRIKLFGFVIMPNHIHLLWRIEKNFKREDVQRDFMKYTSQQILFDLKNNNSNILSDFCVNAKDRKHQIWERNPLSIDLYSTEVLEQKLNYIHFNPLQEKWNLANSPEDYFYSSARFYELGKDSFNILTHYKDVY
jgi:putative transposase